ncbi:MAG: hypothetical protein WA637_10980, partial [Terriglobales bacterium]
SKDNRVWAVAACHIGLTGRNDEGIPTTGIVPAFASVTNAFMPSPQIISRTPARAQGDRTERITSQRIAQHSQSQTAGYCVQANWCAAEIKCMQVSGKKKPNKRCGTRCAKLGGNAKPLASNQM